MVFKGAIMYPIWAIHILTEFAIIAIPFFMMRNVQMVLTKRIKILCAFFARSLYFHPLSLQSQALTDRSIQSGHSIRCPTVSSPDISSLL